MTDTRPQRGRPTEAALRAADEINNRECMGWTDAQARRIARAGLSQREGGAA